MPQIQRLRKECRGYPQQVVTVAVERGLEGAFHHADERRSLAALIAAWLTREDEESEAPPIADAIVEEISKAIRLMLH
jgi:hypothetical protein